VATDLTRIGQKARKEPGLVFTSLYHHIYDVDNLRACYDMLEANKATGVDGVTKEEYGKIRQARARVLGHLSYYAITDNAGRCSYYVYRTKHILFKWLNRKSQRKAYTWESFTQALSWGKWPQPRIRKDLNPCRRAEAH
jgi:hypothetical protein